MNGLSAAEEPEPNESGADLRVLLARGVVRSFPWVIALILLGASAGIVVGLLQPNRYVSNAKLALRVGAREQLTAESLVAPDERQRATPPTMADELQMLSDVGLFERVARDLGPRVVARTADPARDDGPRTSAPVRLAHLLQACAFQGLGAADAVTDEDALLDATKLLKTNTTVTNEPGSSVILVSHTSTSPELARSIVQALANAFIARHREQFSIHSLLVSSRSRLAEVKLTRDACAKAFVEQVSQSGIAALETQVPRLETELGALESELFAARLRREEIARLRTSLSSRLLGVPTEVEVLRPAVMIPNEDYETQLALKRMLLAQKQELLIQSRPSEESRRRDKAFDEQIGKLDLKLKEMPRTIAQGSQMHENLGHAALQARIVDLDVESEALPVKLGLLETRVDTKRTRLGEIQKELLGASMLRKDLAAARDAEELRYARLLERSSVLEALDAIDATEGANLRVLQAPTLEREKIGPRRASALFLGLFAGVIAALAFAILREVVERRLRAPEVFERLRGVPVLAVVPRLSSLRRLRERALAGGS